MDRELLSKLEEALNLATDSWLNHLLNYEMRWKTMEKLTEVLESAISHIKSNG